MPYIQSEQFDLPPDVGQNVFFDALPNGMLLVFDGTSIYSEQAPGARTFVKVQDLGLGIAASIRVSPLGQDVLIALGTDQGVGVYRWPDLQMLPSFNTPSYDLEWLNGYELALSGANGLFVLNVLDGTARSVIVPDGAPAGVTFDFEHRLYTGDGFDADPGHHIETGTIKAFEEDDWRRAIETGQPLDFATTGTEVADLLSAGYLAFDNGGDFLVGGGALFGGGTDNNYAAVVASDALCDVLNGARDPITHETPAPDLQQLDPDPGVGSFYYVNYNEAREELYVQTFGSPTVYVFKIQA
jgi:hypothetical protein